MGNKIYLEKGKCKLNNKSVERIDNKEIKRDCQEVRLFLVERNESLRLPNFLEHYRKLGVDRFFIIDNASSDNTVNYLLEQNDVHVFSTTEEFTQKEYWINELLEQYGTGYWCLCVDADELFLFPYYELISLHTFCDYLLSQGCNALGIGEYFSRYVSRRRYFSKLLQSGGKSN